MYWVYLLLCKDKSIYTGITTDPERRFKQHKNKEGGNYTSAYEAKKILYTEKYFTRSEALKREVKIKSWRRDKKLKLVGK